MRPTLPEGDPARSEDNDSTWTPMEFEVRTDSRKRLIRPLFSHCDSPSIGPFQSFLGPREAVLRESVGDRMSGLEHNKIWTYSVSGLATTHRGEMWTEQLSDRILKSSFGIKSIYSKTVPLGLILTMFS